MNIVFIYYDNPRMLRRQIECWNSYAELPHAPKIILVDDGSPNYRARDIIAKHPVVVPFELHRITEDVAWNFAGARNLGCAQCDGWIHVSDMDTLIFADDAMRLMCATTNTDCFYLPRRVLIPTEQPMKPAIVNVTFHRELFDKVGGYDEDYAGHYGREHTDFFERLQRVATLVDLDDVVVRLMPKWMISDACTNTGDRCDRRNTALFLKKRAAGFPKPIKPHRYNHARQI